MRNFDIELNRQKTNEPTIKERLLQGNNDIQFTITLKDGDSPVTVEDGKKPVFYFKYSGINGVYKLDDTHDDYASIVEVSSNQIILKPNKHISAVGGTTIMAVSVDDLYSYSFTYSVDTNFALTENVITLQPVNNALKADLSNVDKTALKTVLKSLDFAQNDLEDVDLAKLYDKGIDAKLMSADGSNYGISNFNTKLRQASAFEALEKRPRFTGLTAKEIRDLFFAHRYEEVQPIDFTQEPYLSADTLILAYQITREGQNIIQVLPPHTENKKIMVELLFSKGISTGSVEIDVQQGEALEGILTLNSMTFDKEGYAGMFIPLENENGYEFISHYETNMPSLVIEDERGNISLGVNKITFKNPMYVEDDGTGNVNVETDKTMNSPSLKATDGLLNQEFDVSSIKSIDKSIRLSNMGSGVADLSVAPNVADSGIFARLGNSQNLNSKYPKSRMYFSNLVEGGNAYIYQDMQKKSFVIQETDQKDPNVTGGTTFFIGLHLVPNKENIPLTQDGSIKLLFVDDADTVLTDVNGYPMGVEIEYKRGDVVREEVYTGLIKATGSTDVHLKVEMDFANEEIISLDGDTSICVQALTKDNASGRALELFMLYTGYRIEMNTEYFGVNNMNLARFLIYPQTKGVINTDTPLGDSFVISTKTNLNLEIKDYTLILSDNGTDIPIFSIYKQFNRKETELLKGKQYKVTAKIEDKNNAFNIALLKYTGRATKNVPTPEVLSYNNDSPVFNTGWTEEDKFFITEDVVSGIHTQTHTFTIPADAKEFAIIMYPVSSQIPTTLKLMDLEGDVIPAFNYYDLTNTSNIQEERLLNQDEFYKTKVVCPPQDASYRYTANNTDTKIPVGAISGGDLIVNNNAWSDAGSSDPLKVQGDFEFKVDGDFELDYTLLTYNEQNTLNEVNIRWQKSSDGTNFTDIPNSNIATTINPKTIVPKLIRGSFKVDVRKGDSIRGIMKSDKKDGFYLQCTATGQPLFSGNIVFKETLAIPVDTTKDLITLVSKGKEVTGKVLKFDIDSNTWTVEDK